MDLCRNLPPQSSLTITHTITFTSILVNYLKYTTDHHDHAVSTITTTLLSIISIDSPCHSSSCCLMDYRLSSMLVSPLRSVEMMEYRYPVPAHFKSETIFEIIIISVTQIEAWNWNWNNYWKKSTTPFT